MWHQWRLSVHHRHQLPTPSLLWAVTSFTGGCSGDFITWLIRVSTWRHHSEPWRHFLEGVPTTLSRDNQGFSMTSWLWAVTCTVTLRRTRVKLAACLLKVYLAAMVTRWQHWHVFTEGGHVLPGCVPGCHGNQVTTLARVYGRWSRATWLCTWLPW